MTRAVTTLLNYSIHISTLLHKQDLLSVANIIFFSFFFPFCKVFFVWPSFIYARVLSSQGLKLWP